ncbi:NAT10 acetyltransferase, partial [Polypterus senegalus]|nr:NAT10 acetyltransferase [Polypterus senegalus]
MPSATIGNRTLQSSSPEVGSVPGSLSVSGPFHSGVQTEAIKQVLSVIEKKVRNLEKKKGKLDDYQAKKNKGERLNQDQLEAVSKFQEVVNNLDFARDLQKGFLALSQDIQKAVKKAVRREQLQREEAEQRRLKSVLEVQFILEKLGEETVRNDFKQGASGIQLSDEELVALDEIYKLVGPERDQNLRLTDQYDQASLHLWELLEAREKAVVGTTYKALKEIIDRVLQSDYFNSPHTHQNGVCEEEDQPVVVDAPESEQPVEPEVEVVEEYTEPSEVQPTEFVNRQFISETQYSSSDKEQADEWSTESEVVGGSLQQQPPSLPTVSPVTAPTEMHTVNPVVPVPPADPVVRKQRVQDLMAQMQGPYNFMQESMLEFESPPMDPAIVSAQPMKTAQTMDMPQMVCPPVLSESRLAQANAVAVQPEATQPQAQGSSFPRPSQSYYNTRAITRGGPRNSRGMLNGFRGPSNGFRGGYDGYRSSFTSTPSSGYGQSQFNTSRDYSNNFQRDGYQQNYKRGAGQGPRGCSRGFAEDTLPSDGVLDVPQRHLLAASKMLRKKIDNRIRVLIENGVAQHHRNMFVVVGDHGRDQVIILHHMLSKATVKARPSVLWCYKKELGFSSHRKKRMRKLQKKIKSGTLNLKQDDPFELFIAATNIRYCYYNETHKILGNTFGMCVLQDFEALTPNLLARTIETVEGGGIVVILLRTVNSLKQLYTMTMNCIVIDDELNILPISSHIANIKPVPPKSQEDTLSPRELELNELKESLQDTQPVGVLVDCCKTLDQAKAVLKFIEAISEKTLRSTVTLTAARGRGKSAALGLAIAGAVAFGYSNIFVTSPSPDNLHTLFEFIFKGFDALQYQEHLDYEIIQSLNPEFNKAVIRVNIFKEHRQTIQYIHPSDAVKLGQAELMVIDEAAAIPLPLLIQQLRQQSSASQVNLTAENKNTATARLSSARSLHEVSLQESIRYSPDDPVEKWLNDLLCLDCLNIPRIITGCPLPQNCELYYVNRDTLFCYHRASEAFLQKLMALYVASHYKNSPNDLQMLSDAPAHHLFCLLPPVPPTQNSLPEVLAVLQVCLEGEISRQSILNSLSRGKKAAGDLIPWTISEQFQDPEFGSLSGGRVVRIAVHPDFQGMGYGTRALQLLQMYYEGQFPCLEEQVAQTPSEISTVNSEAVSLLEEVLSPRKNLPPLLLKLNERPPEDLNYLGVSFGLTPQLLKFWKRSGYTPVYLRQTPNDLTGEHSCIMLKELNSEETTKQGNWLPAYWKDFRRRFLSLLSYQFSTFHPTLALNILQNKNVKPGPQPSLSRAELDVFFTPYDLKRLEMYSRNMVDYHLIMDLIPTTSRLFFLNQLEDVSLSVAQSALLLGIGLQHKSVDNLEKEIELPSSQLMGLFNRLIRKVVQLFTNIQEKSVEEQMVATRDIVMEPTVKSLNEDLNNPVELRRESDLTITFVELLMSCRYMIRGDDEEWNQVLSKAGQNAALISIKSDRKRPPERTENGESSKFKKLKKKSKEKKSKFNK